VVVVPIDGHPARPGRMMRLEVAMDLDRMMPVGRSRMDVLSRQERE